MGKSIIEKNLERRSLEIAEEMWDNGDFSTEMSQENIERNLELKNDWMTYFEETVEGFDSREQIDKELYTAAHLLEILFRNKDK
jgi:hypothetical protein